MKNYRILFLLTTSTAFAAPIQPNLVLSNFQSSAQVSPLIVGAFGGFAFFTVTWEEGLNGQPSAVLTLGPGSFLQSNPLAAQYIDAQASVDFAVDGYWVSRVDVLGMAVDDGSFAGESVWTELPCRASVFGPETSSRSCAPLEIMQSGTITAFLHMRSDLEPPHSLPGGGFWYGSDHGVVSGLRVALTLEPMTLDFAESPEPMHNPEPGTMAMMSIALAGLCVLIRRHRLPGA